MGEYVVQTWGRWDEAWQAQHFQQDFDPTVCQIIVYQEQDIGVVGIERRATEVFLDVIELLSAHQGQGIETQFISALKEAR